LAVFATFIFIFQSKAISKQTQQRCHISLIPSHVRDPKHTQNCWFYNGNCN